MFIYLFLSSIMPSQASAFDIVRYLISYSQPESTLCISATAMSSRQSRRSSIQQCGDHHIGNMASRLPAMQGLRNGFGRTRMNYDEQYEYEPYRREDQSLAGYPDILVCSDGIPTLTPMSYVDDTPLGSASFQHGIFEIPTFSDERRRRSSAISPRTIPATTHETPCMSHFQPGDVKPLTPHDETLNTFHNRMPREQLQSQAQPLPYPSLSAGSSATWTSTAPTYTESPTAKHQKNQQAILALLSRICTEALRRKWHEETERQLINSLTSRHPHRRQRSRGRYSPYANPSSIRGSHATQTLATTASATVGQALGFMDLMRRVASAMWKNVTQQQQQRDPQANNASFLNQAPAFPPSTATGEVERAAIDSMRTLYSLGNNISAVSLAVQRGQDFNLNEMGDIVGDAGEFCRFLGYGEGAGRCEEVGRGLFGLGEADEDGPWAGQGGVL
jgi:hypothetical protein